MADRDTLPLPLEVRARLAELELELSEGKDRTHLHSFSFSSFIASLFGNIKGTPVCAALSLPCAVKRRSAAIFLLLYYVHDLKPAVVLLMS